MLLMHWADNKSEIVMRNVNYNVMAV